MSVCMYMYVCSAGQGRARKGSAGPSEDIKRTEKRCDRACIAAGGLHAVGHAQSMCRVTYIYMGSRNLSDQSVLVKNSLRACAVRAACLQIPEEDVVGHGGVRSSAEHIA